MGALPRVAALYRLLERVRERDAMVAGAALDESSQELTRLRVSQRSVREDARFAADDPVMRSCATASLESCAVSQDRVQLVETERRLTKQLAMADEFMSLLARETED